LSAGKRPGRKKSYGETDTCDKENDTCDKENDTCDKENDTCGKEDEWIEVLKFTIEQATKGVEV